MKNIRFSKNHWAISLHMDGICHFTILFYLTVFIHESHYSWLFTNHLIFYFLSFCICFNRQVRLRMDGFINRHFLSTNNDF